ncbi:MAG: ATP-binding protein [Schwartzia sp.]|nr:ATP-binding protein [Schwartzia sp. (in: firmicutes)]
MDTLTINATIENLSEVIAFVTEPLTDDNCTVRARMQLELVVEELFVNIACYAYHPETGPVTVERVMDEADGVISVTFRDRGVPYNPLTREDPDTTLPLDKRPIGGLGVFLVKKNVDEISYAYREGQNILRFRKKLTKQET